MDAAQALADLVEISAQIESAVLATSDGAVLASTLGDEERAGAVAREALELLRAAGGPAGEPTQVQAATAEGSFFVVRDAGRIAAAVTARDPTVGLVFYDLKTCLRLAGEEEPAAAPAQEEPAAEGPGGARRRKQAAEGEQAEGDAGS